MMTEQEIRHILLLSGGKDSTALALYMHDKYPEIDLEYVFYGKEIKAKDWFDIAKELDLARKFNILSVPTIIIGNQRLSVIIDKNELTDAILQGFLSSVSYADDE